MSETREPREPRAEAQDRDPDNRDTAPTAMEGAVGASDATNGGGAGAGIPDADTAMRAGDAVTKGDPDEDRKKIFPETARDDRNEKR